MAIIEIALLTADRVIKNHFPYHVPVDDRNKSANHFRQVSEEFNPIFGPFATVWTHGFGLLNPSRRWDYWDGYRFKTETDAVLFKLLSS